MRGVIFQGGGGQARKTGSRGSAIDGTGLCVNSRVFAKPARTSNRLVSFSFKVGAAIIMLVSYGFFVRDERGFCEEVRAMIRWCVDVEVKRIFKSVIEVL